MTVPLSGAFNVDNALVALGVAVAVGLDEDEAVAGLGSARPVPGRMELVPTDQPFAVVVDYAHTPAGLDVALSTARTLAGPGRVITVFGAGGDRDQGKRPLMGEAAARWSDVVVLTSDNPRSEDPMAIIGESLPTLTETGVRFVTEPDRRKAIALALAEAKSGDIILLAGKGHERVQITPAGEFPFDDHQVATEELNRLGHHRGGQRA